MLTELREYRSLPESCHLVQDSSLRMGGEKNSGVGRHGMGAYHQALRLHLSCS